VREHHNRQQPLLNQASSPTVPHLPEPVAASRSYAAAVSIPGASVPPSSPGPASAVAAAMGERHESSDDRKSQPKQRLPTAIVVAREEEQLNGEASDKCALFMRMTGGGNTWRDWCWIRDGKEGRRLANWLCYFSIRGFGRLTRSEQDSYISGMVSQISYTVLLPGNASRMENNAKVVFRKESTWKTLLDCLQKKLVQPWVKQGELRTTFSFAIKPLPTSTILPTQQRQGNTMASLLMSRSVQAAAAVEAASALAKLQYSGEWMDAEVANGRRGRGKRRRNPQLEARQPAQQGVQIGDTRAAHAAAAQSDVVVSPMQDVVVEQSAAAAVVAGGAMDVSSDSDLPASLRNGEAVPPAQHPFRNPPSQQ
jgi:hypothetical protein